ncbi:MAG: hypothetical protein KKD55_03845 [Candidatus Omnitrophica bacterium]|nr:hypothetical protein [Candidatus Omnitrophota bacterium]MBU1523130.1 hypothetical protein [Candidatus Omnitrophota bacterium]
MAALIGTIAATYLLGEVVLHRVKVANTVDAAAISSLAPLTRGLNQLRYVGQRMWLNWIQLQSALVVKMILYGGAFPGPWEGYTFAISMAPMNMYKNKQLYDQAKDIAKGLGKGLPTNLKESIYSRVLGGLVDEAKPLKLKEIIVDGETYEGVDYQDTLDNPSAFTESFRAFRRANPSGWANRSVISYSWLKYQEDVYKKGNLIAAEPDEGDYDSFLRVGITGSPPTGVEVKRKSKTLWFLAWVPISGVFVPFPFPIPHPWAKIKIDIQGGRSIGGTVKKKVTYTSLPFFGRDAVIEHQGEAKIEGGQKKGWEVRLAR